VKALTGRGSCGTAKEGRKWLEQIWALAPGMANTAANPRVHALGKKRSAGAKARRILDRVRTGISVTEGTGHVGNTFRPG
jgi:hypothetical protein